MRFEVIGFCTDLLEKGGGSKSINAATQKIVFRIIHIMLNIEPFSLVFLHLRKNLRKNLTESLLCGTRTRTHATVIECAKSPFNFFSLTLDNAIK